MFADVRYSGNRLAVFPNAGQLMTNSISRSVAGANMWEKGSKTFDREMVTRFCKLHM